MPTPAANIRRSLVRSLKLQEENKVLESVATTYYHEFYGSRTGINNRIPICPDCNLPRHNVMEGDATKNVAHCHCDHGTT